MSELRLALVPDMPRTLRQAAGDNADERDVDFQLRRRLGDRIHLLTSQQLFAFDHPHDTVAERLTHLSGREAVRYMGLRAITVTRPVDPHRSVLSLVETAQPTVAVFECSLAQLDLGAELLEEDASSTVAGLFPAIGVLLDEPIELDDRLMTVPPVAEQQAFRPTLIQ